MGCNNDLKKERQLMDKPVKDKTEASKIFKNEGYDFLKKWNYKEAINSYEKGLLQLFYCFSDDLKEEEETDKIRQSLNLNASFFVLLLKKNSMKHYLNEALRIDKNNLKTLYRIAFCYFNLEKFDDSKNTIKKVSWYF